MLQLLGIGIGFFALQGGPLHLGSSHQTEFADVPAQTETAGLSDVICLIYVGKVFHQLLVQIVRTVRFIGFLLRIGVGVRHLVIGLQLHLVAQLLSEHQVGAEHHLPLQHILILGIGLLAELFFLHFPLQVIGVGVAVAVGILAPERERQGSSFGIEAVAVSSVAAYLPGFDQIVGHTVHTLGKDSVEQILSVIQAVCVVSLKAEFRTYLQRVTVVNLIVQIHVDAVVPVVHVRLAVLLVGHSRQHGVKIFSNQIFFIVVVGLVQEIAGGQLQALVPFIHIVHAQPIGLCQSAE